MSRTKGDPVDSLELSQSAVHCYLSAVLCAADCIAALCPTIGVPYQQRWRRLPQRMGFDLSPASLNASELMFESEMHKFVELAGPYFNRGLPLIQAIGSSGGGAADAVLEETASVAVLLNTLAESTETAADLEAPPEMREMLESHAEALRRCSRLLQSRLLPPLQQLKAVIRDCEELAAQTENTSVLDVETSFVNTRGFRYEIHNRIEEKRPFCVALFDCIADSGPLHDLSPDDLGKVAAEVAARLSIQFRPADCLGRIGPLTFGVIFESDKKRIEGRCEQMAHALGGTYQAGSGSISLSAQLRIVEVVDAESLAAIFTSLDDAKTAQLALEST